MIDRCTGGCRWCSKDMLGLTGVVEIVEIVACTTSPRRWKTGSTVHAVDYSSVAEMVEAGLDNVTQTHADVLSGDRIECGSGFGNGVRVRFVDRLIGCTLVLDLGSEVVPDVAGSLVGHGLAGFEVELWTV